MTDVWKVFERPVLWKTMSTRTLEEAHTILPGKKYKKMKKIEAIALFLLLIVLLRDITLQRDISQEYDQQ
jgi:hypothetical protein